MACQEVSDGMEFAWDSCAEEKHISKCSKLWWNGECSQMTSALVWAKRFSPTETAVDRARQREQVKALSRRLQQVVRSAKRGHYNQQIAQWETTTKLWELVKWTKAVALATWTINLFPLSMSQETAACIPGPIGFRAANTPTCIDQEQETRNCSSILAGRCWLSARARGIDVSF